MGTECNSALSTQGDLVHIRAIGHLKTPILLESGTKLSYKITINGITAAGKAGNVYPVNYLGGNVSYTYFGNGYHKIPN